ncbi:MAG: dihydroxyacetone kinase subunit L [Anaerolineae bacterium]|nr:dihydroxyacetone kinase subunit L [Anaerolineae bacterium]
MPTNRAQILDWIRNYAVVIRENRDYLTQLDSAIGDADHGANMDRGFQAVVAKLPTVEDKDIGTILKSSGMTLLSTVGGAGGPLYGTLFMQFGTAGVGKEELADTDVVAMFDAGLKGVVNRGKAEVGDKTMVDALTPAVAALREAVDKGEPLPAALAAMRAAAEQGMTGTIPLVARKGRASYLGERSAGHQDPGATSSYLLLKTAAETLTK